MPWFSQIRIIECLFIPDRKDGGRQSPKDIEGHQDNQQVGRFGHPRRARTHEAGSERVRDEEERERKTGCQPVEEEAEEDEGKAVRWGAALLLTVARSLP